MSEPSIYQALGDRIRRNRTAIGMSQGALARAIGMHRPSLTLIETGQQKCAIHELLAISNVLHVSTYDLLLGLEA